jgi:tetratricopeptide (TPR) repeat protein
MTRAAIVGTTVLLAAGLLRAQTTPPATSGQTFRASTDVVMVDVAVRSGDRAVPGLTAADFVLTDNGVRQVIESVETTAVPIDVTLVVDVSGSPVRPWRKRIDPRAVAASINTEVRSVSSLLRPTDRIRLLAIDRYVQQIFPFTSIASIASAGTAGAVGGAGLVGHLEVDGLAATYETLAAAVLQPVELARRHVVIARTKGLDTISAISAAALGAVVERSDALLHLVLMEAARDRDTTEGTFQCAPLPSGPPPPVGNPAPAVRPPPDESLIARPPTSLSGSTTPAPSIISMGMCQPTNRSWMPWRRELISGAFALSLEGAQVKAAVEATGGRWHQTVGFSEPSLLGAFKDTFENFRTNYVLRYSPQGVARTGWHTINVTVPRSRNYVIRARKGYGVDAPAAAPSPPPPVANPRTLPELTYAYDRGAYQAIATSLRQMPDTARLIKEFESAGNPWPATPRREAAFVLELAEPSVFSSRMADREAAHRLLERFTRLVRDPLEPVAFERYWHFAVLSQLQGALQPSVAVPFAERALARFPTEPQFLLARAIIADQGAHAARMRGQAVSAEDDTAVRQYYEAAMPHPEVAVESRIRLGWHLHRVGQHADALRVLADAHKLATTDPALRYLRELFTGFVQQAQGDLTRAIAAYRSARVVGPTAQSARVALMNALMLRGDREEAEALAEQIQAEPLRNVADPWWPYWQGQYRFHVQIMARLREMGR